MIMGQSICPDASEVIVEDWSVPNNSKTNIVYRFVGCTLCKTFEKKLTLQWRHNERDGVWNHQPHDCLLNGFRKYQTSASPVFVRGIHRFPTQRPLTRKMFPFDDVIMILLARICYHMMKSREPGFTIHAHSLWPSDAIWRHRPVST